MIADFSGDYLNYNGTNDGDEFVISGEGKVEYNETLKKDMFNMPVQHNGKTKTWSPNNKQGQQMQDAYGMDTKDWIGKVVQVIHADNKMLIRPILSKK